MSTGLHRIPRRLRAYRPFAVARAFTSGVREAEFRSMIEAIDGTPMHSSPPVRLLVDGDVTFDVVLEALGQATQEILIETYIMRDDQIGTDFRDAMAAAIKRGVKVSLLVDAVGSATTRGGFWEKLKADGVVVRHFHPFLRAPLQLFQRDHRKIIVVDRNVAFTGGLNIAEEYGSSLLPHGGAWRDTFIRVEGTVAAELAAVFAEGWDRAKGPPLEGLEYVSWAEGIVVPQGVAGAFTPQAISARVRQLLAHLRDRRKGRHIERTHKPVTDGKIWIAVLDPRPGRAQRETLAIMSALLGGARERLWITTPYFAPPTRALRLLARTALTGVDVRLLLPSRTDVNLLKHAAHGAYSYLLQHGVRIFEYKAAVLHSKTFVVDGYVSMVGSSNLDYRSFWLNAECNLLVFDEGCGSALEEAFLNDLTVSEEITREAWSKRGMFHTGLDFVARSLRWAL